MACRMFTVAKRQFLDFIGLTQLYLSQTIVRKLCQNLH